MLVKVATAVVVADGVRETTSVGFNVDTDDGSKLVVLDGTSEDLIVIDTDVVAPLLITVVVVGTYVDVILTTIVATDVGRLVRLGSGC